VTHVHTTASSGTPEQLDLVTQRTARLLCVLDADLTVRRLSPAVSELLGWDVAELRDLERFSLVHPDDVPTVNATLDTALHEPDRARSMRMRLRARDGGYRLLQVSVTNLLDDPAVGGIVLAADDITSGPEPAAVVRARHRLATAFDHAAVGMVVVDPDGVVEESNPAFAEIVGVDPAEVVGAHLVTLLGSPQAPGLPVVTDLLGTVHEPGPAAALHHRVHRPDGTVRHVRLRAAAVRDVTSGPTSVFVQVEDETEQRAAAVALEQLGNRLSAVVETSMDAVVTIDERSRIAYANPATHEIFGWPPGELVGRSVTELMPVGYRTAHVSGLAGFVAGGPPTFLGLRRVSVEGLRSDGTVFPVEITVQEAGTSGPREFIATLRDVTVRRGLEDDLRRRASTDALTGLANRSAVLSVLATSLATPTSGADRVRAAVLFCDLDRFHLVNDSLGHAGGDQVLVEVATRLQALVAATSAAALVGRMGGDEFVIVLPDTTARDVERLAEAVLDDLDRPVLVDAVPVTLAASVGVALADEGDDEATELVQRADLAMYDAKRHRHGRWRVYDERLRSATRSRLADEHALRDVLDGGTTHGRLVAHVQPVVRVPLQQIEAFEALVRWQRPGHGLVQPGAFVPMAEETGLVVGLGRWMLGEATRMAATWRDELGPDAPHIAVNVSARHLAGSEVVDDVRDALARTGLPAGSLTVELTESALAGPDAPDVLGALSALGVTIALDDFGTGWSSLHRLASLPVDFLKVDRRFVSQVPSSARDTAVLRSVTGLAVSLDMGTVAEGVETRPQLWAVQAAGCTLVQGFWFSRPVPEDVARAMLDGDRRLPGGAS
jgi:diguanylate cyclase (GGDEF)-like protein/PAS domain S-box-containing protein